jgi:hypothetical protein
VTCVSRRTGSLAGVETRDSCYMLVAATTNNFSTAQSVCTTYGGHLVTTRQTDWSQSGVLSAVKASYVDSMYWIGLSRYVGRA